MTSECVEGNELTYRQTDGKNEQVEQHKPQNAPLAHVADQRVVDDDEVVDVEHRYVDRRPHIEEKVEVEASVRHGDCDHQFRKNEDDDNQQGMREESHVFAAA